MFTQKLTFVYPLTTDASEQPAVCKLSAARKPAAVRKATAASPSHGDFEKFSGERKGPPEAIVVLFPRSGNGHHPAVLTSYPSSPPLSPQISPLNIMPIWWKRSQWRLQFPLETRPDANITMKSVKEGRLPDYGLSLCPDWTTGRKAGSFTDSHLKD